MNALLIYVFFYDSNETQAEARAEFAERSVQKLQKEVDRLEGIIIFRFSLPLQFSFFSISFVYYLFFNSPIFFKL